MGTPSEINKSDKKASILSGVLLSRLLSITILIGFVSWGGWFFIQNKDDLSMVLNITLESLLILIILAVIKLIIMGLFSKVILLNFGINLGFSEWFGLSAISTMGNYLSPFQGGAAMRGLYLKSKRGLPYSHFISTLSVLYILSFSTTSIFGMIAMIELWVQFSISNIFLTVILLICLLLPFVLICIVKFFPNLFDRWARFLGNIVNGWNIIIQKPKTLLLLVCLSILNALATLLIIHFSFLAIGQQLPIIKSLLVSSLFLISAMLPITPAGLGIAEIALILTSTTLNVDSTASIVAAGLNRSILLTTSIAFGTIFSYILSNRKPD